MKTLFISNDPTIFEQNSVARKRMQTYAKAIGELHIISRGTKTEQKQEGSLFLHSIKPLSSIFGRLLFFRTLATHSRELVQKYNIEIVSAQDPFEHGAIASHAVSGTTVKLHIQVHTDFCSPFFARESRKNAMRMRMADSVLPKADGIRVVSNRVKNALMSRYGNRIQEPVVIPIASNINTKDEQITQYEKPFNPPFPFVLMAVGRLEKEKRLQDAIRVVDILIREHYPITFAIVGKGSRESALRALVNKLGIEKHVVFLGERNDISSLLSRAQAFIQTSAYEGYGRTYIEAALSNSPMVVTDTGVIGELFVNKESALICAVGDINCLVRSVANLIEGNAMRHELREKAKEVAQTYLKSLGDIPVSVASDLARVIKRT